VVVIVALTVTNCTYSIRKHEEERSRRTKGRKFEQPEFLSVLTALMKHLMASFLFMRPETSFIPYCAS
jgi:hypothetical protein